MLIKKVWVAPLATTKGFWYDYWVILRIEIPRKNGIGTVTFTSGWMVEAGGKIKLNTPYGGK